MARSMPEGNTDIYRFKCTATGVHTRDGWGHKAGDPYETVSIMGPYYYKVSLQHWRAPGSTLKVEFQKLDANPTTLELQWYTQSVMILEDEKEVTP